MTEQSTNLRSVYDDEDEEYKGDQLQLVTFGMGDEEFAVDILIVQEINRMSNITRVPGSPTSVKGVINLRGRIIPVIDLRERFKLEKTDYTAQSRIIVIELNSRTLGFIVDYVNEVLRIDSDIVDPTSSLVAGIDSDYIKGVGKLEDRLLILLDVDRLFSAETMQVVEDAKSMEK